MRVGRAFTARGAFSVTPAVVRVVRVVRFWKYINFAKFWHFPVVAIIGDGFSTVLSSDMNRLSDC